VACDEIVIVIEIIDINHSPSIVLSGLPTDTLMFSTPALTPLQICIGAQDIDGDDIFLQDTGLSPANGTLSLESLENLCLEYTPDNTFLGTDWFTATVCDNGDPTLCDTVVIGINVFSTNNAPQILIDGQPVDSVSLSAFEGITASRTFTVIDDENDIISIFTKNILLGKGQLDLTFDGQIQFEYQPEINSAGLHQISFEVCDNGLPVLCDSIFVEINVVALNQAPVAQNDSLETIAGQVITANVLMNDSDPDDDSIIVDVDQIEQPESGILEISSTGDLRYFSDDDFSGVITILYTISDVRDDNLFSTALIVIDIEPPDRLITVFEALSPNEDDINDFWLIKGLEYFPNNVVRVFDRWNNFVFEAVGYNNNDIVWKGEANKSLSKSDVSDGTYFYIIIPGDGSPQLSGKVILKR